MSKRELLTLTNALLNQNGYDKNGSKITDSSKNQNDFEKKMIKVPFK